MLPAHSAPDNAESQFLRGVTAQPTAGGRNRARDRSLQVVFIKLSQRNRIERPQLHRDLQPPYPADPSSVCFLMRTLLANGERCGASVQAERCGEYADSKGTCDARTDLLDLGHQHPGAIAGTGRNVLLPVLR